MTAKWLSIFLLITSLATAQKPLYVSLERFALEETPGNFYVESVSDARDDTSHIGFTMRGMMNEKVPAYFQGTAEQELGAFFARSFFEKEGAIPIHIRLNYIAIYEFATSTAQFAYAELNMTFLTREGSSYYEMFESAVIVRDRSGFDVSRSHGYNIKLAIDRSFDEFRQRNDRGLTTRKPLASTAQLFTNTLQKKQYSVFTADPIPKGIFISFYDFRDQTPFVGRDFTIAYENWIPGLPPRAIIKWSDDNRMKAVWGFSDGKQAYVRVGKYFYPLKKENGGFTTQVNIAQVSEIDNSGMVMAGVIGGLLGMAIYAAVKGPDKSTTQCNIDFMHGGLTPVNSDKMNYGEIYFYFTSYSKPGELTLTLNGKEHCKIARGTYYLYKCTVDKTLVNACFTTDKGVTYCQDIASTLDRAVYICKIKEDQPKLELLNSELETSILEDIYAGKYEVSCKE